MSFVPKYKVHDKVRLTKLPNHFYKTSGFEAAVGDIVEISYIDHSDPEFTYRLSQNIHDYAWITEQHCEPFLHKPGEDCIF